MTEKKQDKAVKDEEPVKAEEPVKDEEESFDDIVKLVDGHDFIEVYDDDGDSWKFGYDRALVLKMEQNGFKLEDVENGKFSSGTLSGIMDLYREFIFPAFRKYQPKDSFDKMIGIISQMGDKDRFIVLMTALYTQPLRSLTLNPTSKSRMKFRIV